QGYVLKESAGEEVVEAIRAMRAGKRYLSHRITETVIDDYLREGANVSPLDSLSLRERDVLQLVVEGRTNAAIAQALSLSPKTVADLADLSIEELSNIQITSVSRHAERLSDAPAAIFVITGEDIRRSGATRLPEALRLAPNLEVARVSASSYAISARGFNNTVANKLLVLIDGRIVY